MRLPGGFDLAKSAHRARAAKPALQQCHLIAVDARALRESARRVVQASPGRWAAAGPQERQRESLQTEAAIADHHWHSNQA